MFEIRVAESFDIIERRKATELLDKFGLEFEKGIEVTINVYQEGHLIATGSKEHDIFKCFAIDEHVQGEGILSILLSALQRKCEEEGIYHYFLFTKVENLPLFTQTLFKVVAQTDTVALLEGGIGNIQEYLTATAKQLGVEDGRGRSAIVMNCNPFTLGHRYLIEKASKESEEVIVFVLEEDASLFDTKSRLEMVKRGVADLKNVKVALSGEYSISKKTFPTYFLKEKTQATGIYTELDVTIFATHFCPEFNIKRRYIGSEPFCLVTRQYNESIQKILPSFGVEVVEVERIHGKFGTISATQVRQAIKENSLSKLQELVPQTTVDFLNSTEGRAVIERIQESSF